jgi:hypothetical protein
MSQYINLLGPSFRRHRLALSLNRAALLLGFTLAALLMLMAYEDQRVEGLREELASAQALMKAQNAYTSRLKGDGAVKGATAIDNDIQQLEADLKSARDSMDVLEGGALGNRDGFARYMQAFSRQAIDGLWLTGFSVGGAGDVSIQGRVVKAELVPTYIQRLNNEPALKGRAFSALEVHRPVPQTGADAASGKEVQADPGAAPRYFEFALATSEPAAQGAEARGEKR